jgi:hypothetical protein
MVTVVGLVVPLALPLHAEKTKPVLAVAVRVTWVPAVYFVGTPVQFGAGLALTDPAAAGLAVFVSVKQDGVKLAVTDLSADMLMVVVLFVPLALPLHEAKA